MLREFTSIDPAPAQAFKQVDRGLIAALDCHQERDDTLLHRSMFPATMMTAGLVELEEWLIRFDGSC